MFFVQNTLARRTQKSCGVGKNNKPNFDRAFLDTEAVSLKSLFRVHRSSASLCTLKSDFDGTASVSRKALSKFPILGVALGRFMVLQGEGRRSDLKFHHGF